MLATNQKIPTTRPASNRYPGGRKREPIAPTTFYRIREHGLKLGADPRLGTVLGTMGLLKELSDAEVAAGFKCAEIIGRYERLKGVPRRHAASPSYQRGFGNGGGIDEDRMTPDQVKAHTRAVRRSEKAYNKLAAMFPTDRARDIVERVCCDNERVDVMQRSHLAACLHNLAEQWDMVPKPRAAAKVATTPDDVALLAIACVDAAERAFAEQKRTVAAFEIVAKSSRERGIRVSDGSGAKTILIRRRGANQNLLDAALRAQAMKKGWTEANSDTGEV